MKFLITSTAQITLVESANYDHDIWSLGGIGVPKDNNTSVHRPEVIHKKIKLAANHSIVSMSIE